ncbi:hypothetical protein [Microbacterium oleivorans]|uniref:hypothetical protein n=1 Tax=Microbacterium oleivorans TaxID=273677 RepID=UPI00080DFCF2|nr:hypothetical protein [Microbacterium oleivorans]
MRSSADPLEAALLDAVDIVADAVGIVRREPAIVFVDGRSGAGKSTFADLLAERLPGATIVRLDDVYPGWDGLREGADTVREGVLPPLRRGERGSWCTWDWNADKPSDRVQSVAPAPVVIVEGAGILTPESAELADVTVWLEAPLAARRARALDRDGESYAPHWERWARQEDAHLRDHHPERIARYVFRLP